MSNVKCQTHAVGDITQPACRVRIVAGFNIRDRPLPALDAVKEIAHVRPCCTELSDCMEN